MEAAKEGRPEGGLQYIPTGEPRAVAPTQGHSVEAGLPSLTPSADAQEQCAWCPTIIKAGTLPATHGICEPCGIKFKAEAQAAINPHLDTSDREEPEELLPPRTSEEFAYRQMK